jgi:2-polyprenyl-3-methyl-5-hydroxy-6-metoxy-1,4-benzoquinol methylase
MSDAARSCWCGKSSLREFGPDYLLCTSCDTLVGQAGLTAAETLVGDDEVDYYGKRYWLEHQRDELGLPDIYERARLDLPERCVHWLKALLRYRRPPARVLEIGAGHGGYTALLQWAGYDATALDLSPWVAEFARERFGIPYLVGPVEQHEFAPQSFDVVVANDVLEHLADPSEAVRGWAALLKTDGLLVIQTPEFNPERSYETLVADADPFLEHMHRAGTEHLYLFSRASVQRLLSDVGLGQMRFEEPVYAYDMLVVAGATLPQRVEDDPAGRLAGTPLAPLLTALIDVHDSLAVSAASLAVSEADRQARLEVIERLDAALKESEADRRQRLDVSDRG